MNDLISRQAAIDAIFGRSHEIIKMRIGNLPSAQPETNCSEFPNNSDLISRQAAIDAAIEAVDTWDGGSNKERERYICEALEKLPSAQPERKTGKWIQNNELKQFFCDQCGEPSLTYDDVYIYSMDFANFCPNCGADMRGESE